MIIQVSIYERGLSFLRSNTLVINIYTYIYTLKKHFVFNMMLNNKVK